MRKKPEKINPRLAILSFILAVVLWWFIRVTEGA